MDTFLTKQNMENEIKKKKKHFGNRPENLMEPLFLDNKMNDVFLIHYLF